MTENNKPGDSKPQAQKQQTVANNREKSSSAAETNEKPQDEAKSDPVRKITLLVMSVCVFMFIWYVITDRYAPYTDLARVKGYVVPIIPEVSENLIEVNSQHNSLVTQGQILARLDPKRYEIAVQNAQANLQLAGQDVGAGTAAIATAQARLAEAQAQLKNTQAQSNRIMPLVKKGVISRADGDKTIAALEKDKAMRDSAQAELEKARQELGTQGIDNPKIKAAYAALEKAQLDLENTIIRAPIDGVTTNIQIDVGHYAQAGQPIMTLISLKDVWLEASLRENSLGHIKPGNKVDILLDIAPGKIFSGEVASISPGAFQRANDSLGTLQQAEESKGWLRDPQRFIVVIKFSDDEAFGLRRTGAQADVVIYSGDNWLINLLGKIWIRIVSLFSYLY